MVPRLFVMGGEFRLRFASKEQRLELYRGMRADPRAIEAVGHGEVPDFPQEIYLDGVRIFHEDAGDEPSTDAIAFDDHDRHVEAFMRECERRAVDGRPKPIPPPRPFSGGYREFGDGW